MPATYDVVALADGMRLLADRLLAVVPTQQSGRPTSDDATVAEKRVNP